MSESAAKNSWWTPIRVGLALTGVVLLGFLVMTCQRNCILLEKGVLECQTNWAWFWTSRPNEIGDTLAGFAGVLAFIWIIVTVALQAEELRAQRQELRLTRAEMKEQRKASQKMARSLEAQASIFEDERRVRAEGEAEKKLNGYLNWVSKLIDEEAKRASEDKNSTKVSVFLRRKKEGDKKETVSDYFTRNKESIDHFLASGGRTRISCSLERCRNIHQKLCEAAQLTSQLGEAQRQRLQEIHLSELKSLIGRLLEADVWNDREPTSDG